MIKTLGLAAVALASTTLIAAAQTPERYASASSQGACYIASDLTGDGLRLTAWSTSAEPGSYRLVVTQRTGGGGFDIVQEGDAPASYQQPEWLSDIVLDTEARFDARLSVWDQYGQLICQTG